jgi:Fe-S cluster assembly protein SufD
MELKKKKVTRIHRRSLTTAKDFTFTPDFIRLPGSSISIQNFRRNAWETFKNTRIPHRSEEAWRRTDLKRLQPGNFEIASNDEYSFEDIPENLTLAPISESYAGQVLMMGRSKKNYLDPSLSSKGVIFTDLQTAEIEHPKSVESILGKLIQPDEGKFSSLSASLAQNGLLLYIPKNTTVEQPIHSLIWGAGNNLAHITHILILLDEGSSLTYIHETGSPDEARMMHSGLVEIHVMKGAKLRFIELQTWGRNVWNITHERIRVENNAHVDWIVCAVGSHVSKCFADLELSGEGSSGRVCGLYFSNGVQHLDYDTQQNHMVPHTTSDLMFKGAATGESYSVWRGKIRVAPGADKSDGYQANRNLVLSQNARIDTIPGLEILADDVRCSHGATIGKIDMDQIFYLMSRGIDKKTAEQLIVEGFFEQIIQQIPSESVKRNLHEIILEKLRH